MNAEKRDELLLKIAGDAGATRQAIESHTKQVSDLFKKYEKHDREITEVKIKQDNCPAVEAMKPAVTANKLMIVSIIVVLLLGMLSAGLSIKFHIEASKKLHPNQGVSNGTNKN